MSIDLKAIINSLGMPYNDMCEHGLITYKTKPKGDSGSPTVTLDMAKEGVLLTFDRESMKLIELTFRLKDARNEKYQFPSELPAPLWKDMTFSEVRNRFGEPTHTHPPHKIVNRSYGGVDYYLLEKTASSVMMLIRYNIVKEAISVTFKPASMVQWKPLAPSLLI